MTDTTILRGARALGEAADIRSRATVRRWAEAGCPFEFDGNVRVFDQAKVIKWCADRGINFHVKGDAEHCPEMEYQRLRVAKFKANALEHDESIRRKTHAPVDELERVSVLMFDRVRQTSAELIQNIALASGLSDIQAEETASEFIERFERVAASNPYLPENRTA